MAQQPDDQIPSAAKQRKGSRWWHRIPRRARLSAAVVVLLVTVGVAGRFFWHELIVAWGWMSRTWRGWPPLLRVSLFILAIWGLTVGVARLALATMRLHREKKVFAFTPEKACWVIPTAVMFIWVMITATVTFIEMRMQSTATKEQVHFIYQIITGNWSAPSYAQVNPSIHEFDLPDFRIGASVSFAIILNLTSLGILAWLLKQIRDLPRRNATMLDKINWRVVIGSLKGDVIAKAYPALDELEKRGELTSQNAKRVILAAVEKGLPTVRDLLPPEEAGLLDEIIKAPVAPSSIQTIKAQGTDPN